MLWSIQGGISKMTVYIVIGELQNANTMVVAVYSAYETAEENAERLNKKYPNDYYFTEATEVIQ